MKKVSLEATKVVDIHTHPYLANQEPYTVEEFVRKLSLSVIPNQISKEDKLDKKRPFPGTNMLLQILIRRLARYYSCQPSLEEVVSERNKRAVNFQQYTRSLFEDAKIAGLVVDFGYPTPPLDRNQYHELCGVRLWQVHRIEPVMVRLRSQCSTFGEFIERYGQDLRNTLKKPEILGLKSIIAYRSGLEIVAKNEMAASEQYEEFQQNERAKVKFLRDYCLHLAMEECTKANKVMHIHTGIGDGEVILPKASPSFLINFLGSKDYQDTKVHLVHGGYPWVEEAAFIVSVLPNVYLDISLQNPFAGHGVGRILSQVFELAPFDKVMYGSDTFSIPETNWLGVRLFKESFENLLNSWIVSDYLDLDTAQVIGEMVLYQNFEKVYQNHL